MISPQPPATSSRLTRLPSLTGLRWLAAFAVFVHHCGAYIPIIKSSDIWHHISSQGGSGVSFFFILSGFVLTWSYRATTSTRTFYWRRLARVGPAYVVSCLLVLPVLRITGKLSSPAEWAAALAPLSGLQAWVPATRVFFGGNTVGWSLSCELFFYAVFPFLLIRMQNMTSRRLAWLTAGFIVCTVFLCVFGHRVHLWLYFVFPPARFCEFAVGVISALMLQRGRLPQLPLRVAVPIALLGYGAAGFVPHYLSASVVTYLPYTMLIAAAAQSDLSGRSIFASKPLVRLGEISYCFYLVHLTVLRLAERVVSQAEPPVQYLAALVALAISLLLSWILFRAVERPIESRIRRWAGTRSAPRNNPGESDVGASGVPSGAPSDGAQASLPRPVP